MKKENIEDLYELSPLQQGILFHNLSAPKSGVYVEQLVFTFRGELEIRAFRRAWQVIIDRHPILRTAFYWEGLSKPLQVVHRHVPVAIEEHDWRSLPPTEQRERLEAYLSSDRTRGFDPSSVPLIRFTLIRTAADVWKFLLRFHHLIMDGWSMGLVLQEFVSLYRAFFHERDPELPTVRPYRNYIGWLQRQDLAKAEQFWRESLRGLIAATPLAFDSSSSRDAVDEITHGYVEVQFAKLAEPLRVFARMNQLTLNTVVQGAWSLLLARLNSQEDVVAGASIAGRSPDLIGSESIVGIMIQTLPVRSFVHPYIPVLSWLKDFQAQQVKLRQFGYAPLAKIHHWSDVPQGQPLFESIVVFENIPIPSIAFPEENLEVADVHYDGRPHYPVSLMIFPGARMPLRVTYQRSRYSEDNVRHALRCLESLLKAIVTDPGQLIFRLPLLSSRERHQLLEEWNDTDRDYPRDKCVHELFEEQVAKSPEATAVVFEDASLSYAELNRRANQLGHHLREMGVGPDVRVGICVERGLEMVVGLLAILKAGGAYVPLDPRYPMERLRFMLEDSSPAVLLTQGHLQEQFSGLGLPVIYVGEAIPAWSGQPKTDLDRAAVDLTPKHLAYIIYTSGSTGTPKGVMVGHGNVTRLFAATNAQFRFAPDDVWTLFHSYAFDFSVWEIWGALLYGGRLIVVSKDVAHSPEEFYKLVCRKKVTILNQTPSSFRQLIAAQANSDQSHRLRHVIFGGEALEVAALKPWYAKNEGGATQLVNMYGITETTVHVTYRALQQADIEMPGRSPIGSRIPDLRVYILDCHGEPVPVGVAGELYIGGAGVARGYWNRPDLTAERFLPDPFTAERGARMYKTGDLGKWLSDGNIEFVGRNDFQVKIRGFRIELGEIEARLMEHAGVREAVVVAREDGPGEKRLVAYYRAADREGGQQRDEPPRGRREAVAVGAEQLRAHLAGKLPEYMVPVAYVKLERMPLTTNGKLDRHALPAPPEENPLESKLRVNPRTEEEGLLAEIWSKVLKVSPVGVYDNFFELGGDSILTLQIISQARQKGLQLSPRQLLENPTIAQLAVLAGRRTQAKSEKEDNLGQVPLTPIQRWFFEQRFEEPHHWNQALLLDVDPNVQPGNLEQVLQRLWVQHDALRTRFVEDCGQWRQAVSDSGQPVAISGVDLSGLSEADRRPALRVAVRELQASLSFSRGPLARAAIFEFSPGTSRQLLLVGHHLVVDAVSWRILLEDLETGCSQLGRGDAIQLPQKTTSFGRWAQHLQESAELDAWKEESTYWLAQTQTELSPLPRDINDGVNTEEYTRTTSISLSQEQTRALLRELPAAMDVKPAEVLLAALGQTLRQWTGKDELLIDLEGHGREEVVDGVDLSRTVGWFTTIFPLRIELTGVTESSAVLERVRRLYQKIPNHGIGYGVLRYLNSQMAARFRSAAQPEVLFNYFGQLEQFCAVDALFHLASEGPELMRSPLARRSYVLEVNAAVLSNELRVNWIYSSQLHRPTTIDGLAQEFFRIMSTLIRYGQSPDARSHAAFDFPLAKVDATQLVQALGEVEFEDA